ncbi:MAG: PcfJ domain-containing protein [Clostridium sp.]|nr:PcfJ domain-containing protein [Clostridium sp.]
MIKKVLKTIPIPKADTGRIHEVAIVNEKIRGVIISQKKKIGMEETLILNVYQVSGKNKNDISLLFRVFCQKDDYITFEVDCGKWRTGALLYLVCRDSGWSEYWWNYHQLEFLTDRDAKRVEGTLRRWNQNNKEYKERAAFTLLDQYQQNVKNARLMKKHKKETDVIDADMTKFGELPDDYQTFIEETVFKDENYIFYDTKGKRAFCTSCRKTFILENKHLRHKTIGVWNNENEVRHNRTIRCPYCNKYLQAKSEGMSRQNLVSVKWSVLVQPHDEEVLTRYFCHTKDFRFDFHNPRITIHEGYRTVHRADKATDYMWAKFKQTDEMRWCYYRDRGSSWYPPAETVAPRSVVMYNVNLQETVADTCMKYSVPDIFIENVANDEHRFNSPWLIDNYFNSYRKYPFIEQMLKVGFYRMTSDFLEDRNSADVELIAGQNSILGTLGISKNQYNMLRKVGNPRLKDLEILRYKPDLKWNDFEDLRWLQDDGHLNVYKKYIDLMEYTTLHKLRRYIREQKIAYSQDYFDYTGWLEKMGYDMRNEFNLFPKNFKKTHDEMSKQYVKFKDKQAREEIKRFNHLLKKLRKETAEVEAMNLDIDGLFIRLPNKLEELKEEGEFLHHCVGTYMEKVEKGETMVFFIRQKAAPNKPYYTLEWHGRVIQCRGLRNCDMTPEVKAFVKVFEQKMQEYEQKPEKKHRKAG